MGTTGANQAGLKDVDLRGTRILVAEDEYTIASFLTDYLEELGVEVVGPAGTLQTLGELLDRHPVDAALLDINLAGELVYPVADRLAEAGVPFLLTSGYDDNVPARHAAAPRCAKPYRLDALMGVIRKMIASAPNAA